MEKSRIWNSAKLWLFFLVISIGCIWLGIILARLNDGSDINPVSHYFRDKVITENVSTYYKGNLEYLEYLGEEYILPADKIISLGETSREYKGLFSEKVTKSIFLDDDTNDFIYREESIKKSYSVEKMKKSLANTAFWGRVGSLILCIIGVICGLIALLLFVLWIEDVTKFRGTFWIRKGWLES